MSELVLNYADIMGLSVLIFVTATLYSSVGYGGASGYLAAMALYGLAPEIMKPSALSLNILVSAIATVRFYRAQKFSWKVFLLFALPSIPAAFLGGTITLPGTFYKKCVGLVLLYAAIMLFRFTLRQTKAETVPAPTAPALFSGAAIGLLSGLTGVGGGIFLSPLLLFLRWAEIRQTAGISAAFIFVNSISGLLGHISTVNSLPKTIPYFAVAAVMGGLTGSWFGSRYFSGRALRRLLAVVLAIAGIKFMFS